jgi:hypothetical protein
MKREDADESFIRVLLFFLRDLRVNPSAPAVRPLADYGAVLVTTKVARYCDCEMELLAVGYGASDTSATL